MDACPHCGNPDAEDDHVFCSACGESLLSEDIPDDIPSGIPREDQGSRVTREREASWDERDRRRESGADETAEDTRPGGTAGRYDFDRNDRKTIKRPAREGCPKCSHHRTEIDGVRTSGTSFIQFQDQRFTVVSCASCGYSEFYRGRSHDDLEALFFE